jgi:ferredoxin
MTWRIATDRERCIGSGMCALYADATFTQDDATKVVVLEPWGDELDTIRTAVEACPTQALALFEEPIDEERT